MHNKHCSVQTLRRSSSVSAMFDIDAPCNVIELHLLCKILDIYCEKNINYTILHDGLSYIRYTNLYLPITRCAYIVLKYLQIIFLLPKDSDYR